MPSTIQKKQMTDQAEAFVAAHYRPSRRARRYGKHRAERHPWRALASAPSWGAVKTCIILLRLRAKGVR